MTNEERKIEEVLLALDGGQCNHAIDETYHDDCPRCLLLVDSLLEVDPNRLWKVFIDGIR